MTYPAVLFPDAASVVASIVAAAVDPPVGSRVPNPRPDTFVRVERTGGPRANRVADDAQVTIEAWAVSDEAAHDLGQLCRTAVQAARGSVIDGTAVYRTAEVSGLVNLPDPTTDQSRYTITVQVMLRGSTPA